MWSSVLEDLVDRLIPGGGKGLLGKWTYCRECEGRGYVRKIRVFGRFALPATRDAASLTTITQQTRRHLTDYELSQLSVVGTPPLLGLVQLPALVAEFASTTRQNGILDPLAL